MNHDMRFPENILNTMSTNYIQDTLKPFRSRKSSVNPEPSMQIKRAKKSKVQSMAKLDIPSRN